LDSFDFLRLGVRSCVLAQWWSCKLITAY